MSGKETFGAIANYRTKTHLEWTIPIDVFLSKSWDIISPTFCFSSTSCYLEIHYFRESDSRTWFCITVFAKEPVSNCIATFTVIIKDKRKTTTFGPITDTFKIHFSEKRCDIYDLFKLQDIAQFKNKYNNGTLTVNLDLATNLLPAVDVAAQTTSSSSNAVLCGDFEDLLLSEKKSDVTLEVQGQVFKAHKLLLEARSPVFAAMFDQEMAEKNDSIVKIDNCDPGTFQNFLRCIYTGKLENIPSNDIFSLYTTADKYCISEIKEKCAELLANELTVDTACDVLIMAHMRKDTQLTKAVKDFIVENNKEILVTDKWKTLLAENSAIAAHILMKVVEINSSQ